MKKTVLLIFLLALILTACGNQEPEKSLVEQIDEQLTGTWVDTSTWNNQTIISKWTFYDGQYVVDTYTDGKKDDNSKIGTYSIGTESIHTITVDQKRNVEGSIPFSFDDGKLKLHGANGDLEKEK